MVVLAGGGDFWVRCVRLGSRVLEKTEEGGTIVAVEDTCFVGFEFGVRGEEF